jgi:ADP-ribosylglycohydrolase
MTPTEHSERTPTRSRFVGCLLGGALGDALGYPIERASLSEIRKRLGTGVPERLCLGPDAQAIVSSTTQMTLFTAEGLIRAVQRQRDRGLCHVPTVIQRALLRWLITQSQSTAGAIDDQWPGWLIGERMLHARRAPGNTCLAALEQIRAGKSTPSMDRPINSSKGCGAVTRSAPAGLVASDRREAFELGRVAGALTHGHPSAYLAAGYLASLVFDLVRDVPLMEAMENADAAVRSEPRGGKLLHMITLARGAAGSGPPAADVVEALGKGWVGHEALAIALLCALTADTSTSAGVAQALWRAVCHSGDSDGTGSITGNILGAMVGVELLPAEWLGQIEMRQLIERLATDLYAVAIEGAELSHGDYPPN